MTPDKSDKQFAVFLRRSEHSALIDLWLSTHYGSDDADIEGQISFDERRDAFLWAIERLLREGRIKLHKNGVFLDTPIEEQVEAFRRAFPESVADSGYEDFYWWFFDEACPAGVAWRHADGSYVIAD